MKLDIIDETRYYIQQLTSCNHVRKHDWRTLIGHVLSTFSFDTEVILLMMWHLVKWFTWLIWCTSSNISLWSRGVVGVGPLSLLVTVHDPAKNKQYRYSPHNSSNHHSSLAHCVWFRLWFGYNTWIWNKNCILCKFIFYTNHDSKL